MANREISNITNYHVQYMDVTSQYWNPASEKYAGGDHLMTALYNEWQVTNCVEETHWYAGLRAIKIFRFHLERDGEKMTMPVINNPYVARFIMEKEIQVEQGEQSESFG